MKNLVLLLLAFSPLFSYSQILLPRVQKKCATYEVLENKRKLDPRLETDQQFEEWLGKKMQFRTMNNQVAVTVPVVFHIIHSGEGEGVGTNISQALIHQQILQLNKDYANQSNSPYAVSANTNIQFALAQTNPTGTILTQPGIDRILYSSKGFTAPPYTVGYANGADDYLTATIKPATIWDPARYLNVWILQMESGILGIATFPASSGLPGLSNSETNLNAGVAIGPETAGSIYMPSSCSNYTKGKTLTHELGHFFGLRHIWGDATCGNDYCGDTPVHETSNSGIPTHPKSNNCGTADEMFENYMDYTDDVVTNTFTADQVARIQTVLTNSPRRNTLGTSTAGLVPVTGTNRIAFYDCTGVLTVSETGLTGSAPRYRDYSFTLNVEDKATGNATVTINTGGTALNGFNYQVLTPTLNFVAGDNYKNVSVRVFDNALVEGNKTISLSYSIAGTGVQAGTAAQSMTITILDDDNITVANNTITLFSQNWETSVVGWSTLRSSLSFPNQFVISPNGDAGGSGNVAHITNNTTTNANVYTNTVAGLAVLRSPLIDASGITNLQLSFKYKVWGEVFSGTAYDYGAMTYATVAAPTSFSTINAANTGPYAGTTGIVTGTPTITLPNQTFANTSFYLGWYWENDNVDGNNPALNVDDIVLTGSGTNVETAVSNSYGYDVRSGSGLNNFRSTNNKAILRITNSSSDLSAVTASITQAGSGQAPITTGIGTYQRTQKVFQITPSVANTTASYQVTLYFTSAELAIWGGSKLALKVLKVKDGVSLGSIINSTNAVVVTPVSATEDVASGVVAYTVNFTDGFSQFVLVSPTIALPVGLISFEAQPARNSIELSWKTASERNNKGFQIERSLDGVDFKTIGWVKGVGNASEASFYKYTDHFVQPNTIYYYRLNQVDLDNRAAHSSIRQAKLTASENMVLVTPNPAKDHIKVFVSGNTKPVNISLIDAKGQRVGQWMQVDVSSPHVISVGHFAKGYYSVIIHLADGDITRPVLIQ